MANSISLASAGKIIEFYSKRAEHKPLFWGLFIKESRKPIFLNWGEFTGSTPYGLKYTLIFLKKNKQWEEREKLDKAKMGHIKMGITANWKKNHYLD